jgi:hypothetical protein
VQFSIQLGSFATVVGLIVLRIRQPRSAAPVSLLGLSFHAAAVSRHQPVDDDLMWRSRFPKASPAWRLILLGWIVYFVSPKNDEGMLKSLPPAYVTPS